ncbi:MAG TPA: DNA-directed RNA polymerase subunit omega [Microlunatus sp.]
MTENQTAFQGINNPPIDELLTKADSKYRLVLFAAKRARQINAYYSQLGEGLLEHVGPLVETGVQEKPLSIALREVNAGVLQCIEGEEADANGEQPNLSAVENGLSAEDVPTPSFDDTPPSA